MKKIEIATIVAVVIILISTVPSIGQPQPGWTLDIGTIITGIFMVVIPLWWGYYIGKKEK